MQKRLRIYGNLEMQFLLAKEKEIEVDIDENDALHHWRSDWEASSSIIDKLGRRISSLV